MSRDSTESDLFVRPFGYAADQPVVRGIGDRDLYLGNAPAARPDDCGQSFDHVVSLTRTEEPATTHHCPLTDDAENDWCAFANAVDTARQLYRRDGSVLIHCEAGVSRSSAVAATTVAVEEGLAFVDALHLVQDSRPHAIPHPALHEQGVLYVAAESGPATR